MGMTAELASFAAGIRLDRLPAEVVGRARFLVLDLAGNIVRARHDAPGTPALLATTRALGLAAGSAWVFGDSARYTPAGAALMNGALGYAYDIDATDGDGALHPGAVVIPAALAAGEMAGAAGADVLAAIVGGCEVACRIALALPAGAHERCGFDITTTCGACGAAAAAARVFGLSADEVASALGIALSQSAGFMQNRANGDWTMRFQVGWASLAGLTAATLAREGFKGAADAIEGCHGFLQTFAPEPQPEHGLVGLGEAFEFMRTVAAPQSEAADFPTEGELRAKFYGLTEPVLGPQRSAVLADAVLAIDRSAGVSAMMRLAAPVMAARLAGE